MAPYEYASLEADQIRLVALLPADKLDADIRVRIDTTDLDAAAERSPDTSAAEDSLSLPPFNALSYVWGSEEDPIEVTVTDAADNDLGSLHVTKNLAAALRRLRYDDRSRLLWIDAICINQQDIPERSRLVENMGEIYRRAPRVIVWLGEGDAESLAGLQYIAWIGSQIDFVCGQSIKTMRSSVNAIDTSLVERFELELDDQQCNDVWKFLYIDWFGRLWVQPEVMLGKDLLVHHGSHLVDWATIGRGVSYFHSASIIYSRKAFERLREQRPDRLIHRQHIYEMFRNHILALDDRSALGALSLALLCECKDARDNVFAMRSLSSELRRWLIPDYSKSVAEIYTQLSVRSICETRRLDLLVEAQLGTARDDAPTWVPNWAVKRTPATILPFRSSDWAAFQGDVSESGILRVAGVTLSEVCSTACLKESYESTVPQEYLRIVQNLIHDLENEADLSNAVRHTMDAYCRVLSRGEYEENFGPTNRTGRLTFAELQEFVIFAYHYVSGQNLDNIPPFYVHAWEKFYWFARESALASTTAGHLGLGPQCMQNGDIVCILLGADWPFVLRKTVEGRYRLVGKCFLDGFMHGEALFGPLSQHHDIIWDGDGDTWARFKRNNKTGEVVNLDEGYSIKPELTVEYFRDRGVSIEYFELI